MMKPMTILFLIFVFTGMLVAQDEDIALDWRIQRDNLVGEVIHSWLRGAPSDVWAPSILKIMRVSINLSTLTRKPDPYLLVQNIECMPAAYLEVWLNQQGISLRTESMFEGKVFQLVIPDTLESDSTKYKDVNVVSTTQY